MSVNIQNIVSLRLIVLDNWLSFPVVDKDKL